MTIRNERACFAAWQAAAAGVAGAGVGCVMMRWLNDFRCWLARELEVIQVMLDLGITSRERARRIVQKRRLRAARAAWWGE